MKETCILTTKVQRFLGACVFYLIWIPYFAHVVEPLYELLQKGQRFTWKENHTKVVKKLKKMMTSAHILRKIDYKCGRPVIVTVDMSPMGIG